MNLNRIYGNMAALGLELHKLEKENAKMNDPQRKLEQLAKQVEDANAKIKALTDEIADVTANAKVSEKPFLWKAEDEEEYFFVDSDGGSWREEFYESDDADAYRRASFMEFEDDKIAETASKKLTLPRLLAKLFAEHCPDYAPDYNDGCPKYYFYWYCAELRFGCSDNKRILGLTVFPHDIAEKLRPELERMIKSGEVTLD